MPTSPGVYLFLRENNLLYIGKAKNLRNRLSSYKLSLNLVGKTKTLIDNTQIAQWVETDSELQAIILEANLIKTFTPKFNLRLRDDKSPIYIVITNEPFPRVLTSRKPMNRDSRFMIQDYFGPFSSSSEVRLLLKFLRRAFPFCNATVLQKLRRQACFYYHLGLCSGACKGIVSKRTYRTMIRQLTRFLSGDFQKVINSLNKTMLMESKKLNFESASNIRNQLSLLQNLYQTNQTSEFTDEIIHKTSAQKALTELKQVLHLKDVPQRIECYDVSNLQGKFATAAMVVAINGSVTPGEYRHFKIKTLFAPNDPGMIGETISRRLKNDWPLPNLIIVDGGITQVKAAKKFTLLPIIGLAKREETIVADEKQLHLPRYSLALQLLQQLRDEAHRFSRKLHHKLYRQSLLK